MKETNTSRLQGWTDARRSVAEAVEALTGRRVADGALYVNDLKETLSLWGKDCYEAGLRGDLPPQGVRR